MQNRTFSWFPTLSFFCIKQYVHLAIAIVLINLVLQPLIFQKVAALGNLGILCAIFAGEADLRDVFDKLTHFLVR